MTRTNALTPEIVRLSLGRDLNIPVVWFSDNAATRFSSSTGPSVIHLLTAVSFHKLFTDGKEWEFIRRHNSDEIISMQKKRLGNVRREDGFIRFDGAKGLVYCGEMLFTAHSHDPFKFRASMRLQDADIVVSTTENTEMIGEVFFRSGSWYDKTGKPARTNLVFNEFYDD